MTPSSFPTSLIVVLLHGFGGSSRTWQAVRPLLGGGHRCIAPDLRGFGGDRTPDIGRTFDIADLADDVIDRLNAVGVIDTVVVGHSMGARVALAIAARLPHRVRGLVLLAPSPPTPEPMDDAARTKLRESQASGAAAAMLINSITADRLSPDRVAVAVADVLAADPQAWRSWVDMGSRHDLSGLIGGINCPVVVLSGDQDRAIPTDVVRREVVDRLPQSRLTVVPGAGHLLPLESPEAVAAAVRAMINHTTQRPTNPCAPGRALLDSPFVTAATRRVLQERAVWRTTTRTFFSAEECASLQAVCDTIVPQEDRDRDAAAPPGDHYRVDIVGEIDRRLANDAGDGWRYAGLPPDGQAYRRGLVALDEVTRIKHGVRFHELAAGERHAVLASMLDGESDIWRKHDLQPARLLADWLAEAVEVYYSHLGGGVADMQYVGFADGVGWRRIGLNERDPHERTPATDAEVLRE